MRIWVDLTNSPHVLVMRPVIRALEGRGAQVHVTARDFAQTLGLLERFGIAHEAIGHHRGGRLAAKGLGLASRSLALANWAKGRRFDAALGPRLERRHGRREAARDPERDDVRLRVGDRPAHRQLPARAARRRARRDPARAARALRRDRPQAARVPGAQGGVLPRGPRAGPRRARRARARRRRAARRRAHAAGRLALPPLRAPAVRPAARAAARAGPGRRAAAHARAAGRAGGGRAAS